MYATVRRASHPTHHNILIEFLNIMRETEMDELSNMMRKNRSTFTQNHWCLSQYEDCQHLFTTFGQVPAQDKESDQRAITATGILNTIKRLLTSWKSTKK